MVGGALIGLTIKASPEQISVTWSLITGVGLIVKMKSIESPGQLPTSGVTLIVSNDVIELLFVRVIDGIPISKFIPWYPFTELSAVTEYVYSVDEISETYVISWDWLPEHIICCKLVLLIIGVWS